MDNKTKIVLGIIGGVAAITVIGALVAPGKVSELKKQLKAKASGFADDIDGLLSDVKDQLTGVVKHAEKQVSHSK